jgi:signal peptidase I
VICALVTGLAATGVLLAWARSRWLVVTVDGISMQPAYAPGDRLLVRRTDLWSIRRGQVVVVAATGLVDVDMLVKRVAALPGDPVPPDVPVPGVPERAPVVPADHFVVLGDNVAASHDSRALGCIPARALVGVVLRPMSSAVG